MENIARIMQAGDEVMNVTENRVVILRENGEVDIYKLTEKGGRIEMSNKPMLTIGYEDMVEEEYITETNARVITF